MEGFCRGCLNKYNEPSDLLQYCESNRRLFVYCTGLQVKRNDAFTFQLCKECYLNLKFSCKFKKQCRNADKKFKNYLTLKKDGESMDFCTYLKNVEDMLTLRLPIVSRSSTPVQQRTEDDDDNASTCTSIQNFMTDMLQGEEMPPTEARIIREVIQEEADISDDSLDSHWLQDDVSVDNDFGMDFNFSAFSTPRSINNDHCYTPRRLTDNGEEFNYYTPKETMENSVEIQGTQKNDMPSLNDCSILGVDNEAENDLETEYATENIKEPDKQPINSVHQSDMPLLDECSVEFDGVADSNIKMDELAAEYCVGIIKEPNRDLINIEAKSQDSDVFLQSKVAEIIGEDNPFEKLDCFKDSLFSVSNDLSPFTNSDKVAMTNEDTSQDLVELTATENDCSVSLNKGLAAKKASDSPLTRELKLYMKKVELKNTNSNRTSNYDGMKVLNNENNMCIQNHDKVHDTINQSPLTQEIEQYIDKAKFKKGVESESNSSDKVMSILKGDINSTSNVIQIEKPIYLNQGKSIENVDSPLKRELDQYINKIELKKTNLETVQHKITENRSNNEKCSIDKNLELALKNDDSQEFSLDQLLMSPQVSIRSGISTPTINNILFGNMTPKSKNTDLIASLEKNDVKKEFDPTDFIEKFLKDTDDIRKSAPQKGFQIAMSKQIRGFKDINKLKELEEPNETATSKDSIVIKDIKQQKKLKKTKSKKHSKKNRGYKDIKKLKDLFKLQHNDQMPEFSENDHTDSLKEERVNAVGKEIDSKTTLQLGEIEDLDISISSLLNFDDSQSIDLNLSISSDFLKDEKLDDDEAKQKCFEDPFKRPFSPPDNKYDMDKCLCKICDKTYASSKALKIHFVKTHKLKLAKKKKSVVYVPKVCQKCGKAFRDKSNLNRHLKKHDGPSTFQCSFCTLHFATQGRLSQHMRAHASEITRKENKDEENNRDNKSNKRFVCSTCGKVSTTMANFKVHQRRHTKSFTVKCEVCQKGFYRKHDLNIHMGTHNASYTFACQYCPKVYKRRDLLMGHVYRHIDKKQFACETCNKQFVSKHILKTHYTSQICLKNRENLAKEALESPNVNAVTVTSAVGGIEKIKKIVEIEKPEEINPDNSELNKKVKIKKDSNKDAQENSNENSVAAIDVIGSKEQSMEIGKHEKSIPECLDLSKKSETEPTNAVVITTDLFLHISEDEEIP